MEEKYKRYLEIPTYSVFARGNDIYTKGWYVQTGLACMHPHPHRHYNFDEFIEECKVNEELNNL